MPFIETKTSVTISKEQESILKEKLARAIETIPGKSEAHLMLSFNDNQRMWFRGDNQKPICMVDICVLGKSDPKYYDNMTNIVTKTYTEILGIPGDQIFVKYSEYTNWGLDGANF